MIHLNLAFANVQSYTDRSTISMNESFQLMIESDVQTQKTPDFSQLERYFDIISRSQSQSFTSINGQFSRKTTWTLTLMAKSKQSTVIPSITIGNESSKAIPLSFNKTRISQNKQNNSNVFIEIKPTPKSSYVQAQIILNVKLYLGVNIGTASLSNPTVKNDDAVIEKLGEDKRYQAKYQGKDYIIYERNYAVFPQISGQLTIDPIQFEGEVNERRSLFSFRSGNVIRTRSDPIVLNIKPIPATANSDPWVPAKALTLVENWEKSLSNIKVGESITRTIQVIAEGLTAAQLPEIKQNLPKTIKQYPDQPVLQNKKKNNGIVGVRQEKIALIPNASGEILLPSVSVNWWNTETDQLETAMLPAKTISVQALAKVIQQPNSSPVISSVPTPLKQKTPLIQTVEVAEAGFWKWMALFFGVGWLVTIGFMVWRHFNSAGSKETNFDTKIMKLSQIEKQLKIHCRNNQAKNTKQTLFDWLNAKFPKVSTKGDVNQLFLSDEVFYGEIEKLNQSLYRETQQNWEGQNFWQTFKQFRDRHNNKNEKSGKKDLESLYL
ncbi:MAG: protein BatD [Methylococcales bacterium]|nr:protein BatD [Methylococcales bacterium]MBT7410026.1 protein BatD [Methylococcales bacterium]